MAKDKIIIGIDNETFELKGEELDAFIESRKIVKSKEQLQRDKEIETQKQLKIDAYKKLGLTDEEINAIL
jgi:hypothetical protein